MRSPTEVLRSTPIPRLVRGDVCGSARPSTWLPAQCVGWEFALAVVASLRRRPHRDLITDDAVRASNVHEGRVRIDADESDVSADHPSNQRTTTDGISSKWGTMCTPGHRPKRDRARGTPTELLALDHRPSATACEERTSLHHVGDRLPSEARIESVVEVARPSAPRGRRSRRAPIGSASDASLALARFRQARTGSASTPRAAKWSTPRCIQSSIFSLPSGPAAVGRQNHAAAGCRTAR